MRKEDSSSSSALPQSASERAKLETRVERFTPGPWHVGAGGFHANRVWTPNARPIVNLCSMGTAPADIDPEAQANGRLIAAAPEMYSALAMVQRIVTDMRECGSWDAATMDRIAENLAGINGIIAKATGTVTSSHDSRSND